MSFNHPRKISYGVDWTERDHGNGAYLIGIEGWKTLFLFGFSENKKN